MAAYSKRHYGKYQWQLTDPKLIVIHFAVAGSVDAIYNTFAPNRPDVEYGELPGVCSQYAVGAQGGAVRFVPQNTALVIRENIAKMADGVAVDLP